MDGEVLWTPAEGTGLEHLRLHADAQGARADGLIIGVEAGRPFRLHYTLRCDAGWRTRELWIAVTAARVRHLRLTSAGDGRWTDGGGAALPALDGCIDVDLTATPFTNTLPIRRLGLRPGESGEIAVAWVDAATLAVTAERQRYTCLETGPEGGRYRFEALGGEFVAEIDVDAEGLVVAYPGLFRRV